MSVLGWSILLFVYINVGYALASFCWWRYHKYKYTYDGLICFLLWPMSTLEERGWWQSEGGCTPIINDSGEAAYKTAVSLLWPLKIIANSILIAVYLVLVALVILSRLIATLAILAIKICTYPARMFFGANGIGQIDLRTLWLNPIVIKGF